MSAIVEQPERGETVDTKDNLKTLLCLLMKRMNTVFAAGLSQLRDSGCLSINNSRKKGLIYLKTSLLNS